MTGKRGWKLSEGIESIEMLDIAVRLLSGGVRPTHVESVTKVSKHRLSALWNSIHKHPAKGQTPAFAYTFIKNGRVAKQAGIYLSIFRAMVKEYEGIGVGQDDLKLFLNSFDFYATYSRGFNTLNMEQCFYLWRDYRKKSMFLKFCSRCQSNYAYSQHQDAADCLRSCQHCKTILRAKRKGPAKHAGMLSVMDVADLHNPPITTA
jgi:hypothetical protein